MNQVAAPKAPTLTIQDDDGRTLLTLDRREGGRLVAEYAPADLDAAATIFVREVLRIAALLDGD